MDRKEKQNFNKIYGHSVKDTLGLIEYLKTKGNQTLSKSFSEYALKTGKAKGTVRNLYYALAKKSKTDSEFCKEYLAGKPLNVNRIEEFSELDEQELVQKIVGQKIRGRSVRSVIMELSGGDGKKALRYQNKYRNTLRKKPMLVQNAIRQCLDKEQIPSRLEYSEFVEKTFDLDKTKEKIQRILDRAMGEFSKEKSRLESTISRLEEENALLKRKVTRHA